MFFIMSEIVNKLRSSIKKQMCYHKNKSMVVVDVFDIYEKTKIMCCDCKKILK